MCLLAGSHLPPPCSPNAFDTKACLRESGWFFSSNLAQNPILFVGSIPGEEVGGLVTAEGIWALPPIHLSTQLSTHTHAHPPIHTPFHPSIHLSTHPLIHPSIYAPIHLPIHPSVHLSAHPSIHPTTHSHGQACMHPSIITPLHFLNIYLR